MLTVRGQQHSFATHEQVFLWKCQSFWFPDIDISQVTEILIHFFAENNFALDMDNINFPCGHIYYGRFNLVCENNCSIPSLLFCMFCCVHGTVLSMLP